MASSVHATSIICDGAVLKDGVVVGPFCFVGPDVVIEEGVQLLSHISIQGKTSIGKGTKVYPFASIGHDPQHVKHDGRITKTIIGAFTVIREHVTIHGGTSLEQEVTKVGDHCFLMAGAHIAHDCHLEDHVIVANNVLLGGHVFVGARCVLGGMCAIHQFVHVGEGAMISGTAGVLGDIIPYGFVFGSTPSVLIGINIIGLQRQGVPREEIMALRQAYDHIFSKKNGVLIHNVETLPEELCVFSTVRKLRDFLLTERKRALCLPSEEEKNGEK